MVVMSLFSPVPCAMRQGRANSAEASLHAARLRTVAVSTVHAAPGSSRLALPQPSPADPAASAAPPFHISPDVDAAMAADRSSASAAAAARAWSCACTALREVSLAASAGVTRPWDQAASPGFISAFTVIRPAAAPHTRVQPARVMTSTRDGGNDVLLPVVLPAPPLARWMAPLSPSSIRAGWRMPRRFRIARTSPH